MQMQWRSRNTSQCKRIQKAVYNNLELQMLVLSTIEKYEVSQKAAQANGTTVALMQQTPKAKKDENLEDKPFVISEPLKEVGRGRMYYNKWPKKQYLQELLCFMEPSFDMKTLAPLTDRMRLLELTEYALDIRCTDGEVQDKADHKMAKGFLFKKLALLYKSLGSRLAPLKMHFHEGYIKWGVLGHYELEVTSGSSEQTQVALTCKSLEKRVVIEKEIFGGDPGPFELSHNYSMKDAYIVSPSEKYNCQNFFPALARKLKRQLDFDDKKETPAGGQEEKDEDAAGKALAAAAGGVELVNPIPKKLKQDDSRNLPKPLDEEVPQEE